MWRQTLATTDLSNLQKHVVDLTGDYETSIFTAARRLLAEGAAPADEIETQRDGIPCMRGSNIGKCAKLTVRETPQRGPEVVRYQPFPVYTSGPKTAVSDAPATFVA
jgi:hypothetical protein